MHRGGREGGANYLQVVTKDTLEDQVGLSISIVRLASRGGIQLASLKEIFFLFQMKLFAKCLVIFQLTISILGVLRRQRIPLLTDPHTGTGVSGIGIGRSDMSGIGSSNCSKSNSSSSSSNVGRPELAQSYTNLGLTQDGGMEGTMKRGAKSEVAHLWAKWLRHPCRLGDPHRCRAGG